MQICVHGLENLRLANYSADMSILSENITFLRGKATQAEFSERLGVGQSTVVRWEKGSNPQPDNLLALAKIARVSIEQLITTPLSMVPKMTDGDLLPSESDFQQMVSDALQEVPPGTPLSGYSPIVASSLRDRLVLLLKHGAYQGSSAASIDPGKASQSRAPTKARAEAGPRNR
jgi:transcriptional regulator with XRE-family HTH domain